MIAYSTAVLTIFAFTFQSKTAGSTMDFTGLSSASSDTLVRDQIKQAETLRNIGKRYLSTRQYNKAATCYAAVLQVIEGVGGTESGELRRRCCLTLAECEIKTGNLYAAIARCTEVIEECPEVAFCILDLYCIYGQDQGRIFQWPQATRGLNLPDLPRGASHPVST